MDTAGGLLTVLDKCRISPPSNTVGERSLPLTFFDLLWLFFCPVHQLFFYEFPYSKPHFIQTIIPTLKHSLSITLQHFFPFAGNLIVFPTPNHSNVTRKPEIRYLEGDSIALIFAESDLDFIDLTGNHPRDCNKFYDLVPLLEGETKDSDFVKIPLFSVQVTLFPNSGITIGITNNHILCDANTKFDFMKAWTSIAKSGSDELFLASGVLPFYDRSVIKYPSSLDEFFLNHPDIVTLATKYKSTQLVRHAGKVRATIVITRAHINRLKKRVTTELPNLEYVSSFSVVCGYVWSLKAKSCSLLGEKDSQDELEMFHCPVNWRSRMNPPIPQSYFGNCVGACTPIAKSTLLSETNGFLVAAELVGKAIRETLNNKDRLMEDAETWKEKFSKGIPITGVAGTPKNKIYDLDFGWGKPKKYEPISIDHEGTISVTASKQSSEDIEIGLSLPAKQMDVFIAIFKSDLESIFSEQE